MKLREAMGGFLVLLPRDAALGPVSPLPDTCFLHV